jgi:hypothetical protein
MCTFAYGGGGRLNRVPPWYKCLYFDHYLAVKSDATTQIETQMELIGYSIRSRFYQMFGQ